MYINSIIDVLVYIISTVVQYTVYYNPSEIQYLTKYLHMKDKTFNLITQHIETQTYIASADKAWQILVAKNMIL